MDSGCTMSPAAVGIEVRQGAMMTTDDLAAVVGPMPKYSNSYKLRRSGPSVELKARQSAKIREIAQALVSEGFVTLTEQAEALGLRRSTAWTILKSKHKSSGLSARIITCMLAARQRPLVRAKILEYIEEKASGRYGHRAPVRRKFIAALSANEIENVKVAVTVQSRKKSATTVRKSDPVES